MLNLIRTPMKMTNIQKCDYLSNRVGTSLLNNSFFFSFELQIVTFCPVTFCPICRKMSVVTFCPVTFCP